MKRNAGWHAAETEVVAFLDDDAEVREDYFTALRAVFGAGAQAIAGAIEPRFEAELPEALRKVAFNLGGFNRWDGREEPKRWIGANCAFRREVLVRAGPFDPRLGPGGTWVPWGDDAEMFWRLRARGLVAFAPEVTVFHHIQPERLTRDYVLRRAVLGGRTLCVMDWLHKTRFWGKASRVPLLVVWSFVRGLGSRDLAAALRWRRFLGYTIQMLRLVGRRRPRRPV